MVSDAAGDPTARALDLLAAFTARPQWSGAELAHRLGVTPRTVRRDVDRLRGLGYEIDGTTGVDGGYRFHSGAAVAPLFLDDDEAVAIVTALVAAASDGRTGMVDPSTSALAKLRHVLPADTRRGAEAVRETVRSLRPTVASGIDPAHLAALAVGCRSRVAVRFGYTARGASSSERRVEPHALVTIQRSWYLVGFDLDRRDWRTFRLDRVQDDVEVTGHGIEDRTVPGGDALAFVLDAVAEVRHPHVAHLDIAIDGPAVRARVPWLSRRRITPVDDGHCRVRLGASDVAGLARQIADLAAAMPVDAVEADDATTAHLRHLATLFAAATIAPR
jgi:predicted DNA-binding transcriptional regulator YafY